LVHKLLEKNPRDRFQSSAELVTALEDLLADRSKQARQASRGVGRRPVWAWATAAAVLAILAAFFFRPGQKAGESEKPVSFEMPKGDGPAFSGVPKAAIERPSAPANLFGAPLSSTEISLSWTVGL